MSYFTKANMHAVAELSNAHWGIPTGLGVVAGMGGGASGDPKDIAFGGILGGALGAGAKMYGNAAVRRAYRGTSNTPWKTGNILTQQVSKDILL